jgi:hypothetical protein
MSAGTRRRRVEMRRLLVPAVAALVAGAAVAVGPAAEAAEPTGPGRAAVATVTEAATAATATAAARSTGRRVEVTGVRTELSQVFAEADGTFTYESTVVPQRVRRPDGSWVPVDLALRREGEIWRPTASTADVRFSNGGTGPMVTLVAQGRTFTLSWPGTLPAPVVAGDSATYPNVLPEVDLVLRATWSGFTHVLVVRSSAAAAHPTVRQLTLTAGGDARLGKDDGGGLRIRAGSAVLATAPAPAMWDSAVGPPVVVDGEVGGSAPSTASGPGDTAHVGAVTASIPTITSLRLVPDAALLTASTTKFPVFIDPEWSTGKARWAYATHNNSTNSTSVARVGLNPDSGVRYRSYFDFPLGGIAGKHVESAYVQMKLDHSWSCGDTYTHMYWTSGIATTPRTRWALAHRRWLASAASHANEGAGCGGTAQPDMWVNFIHSTVTSTVNDHARGRAPTITIGFCACNADNEYESTQNRWKKFFPNNAKLIANVSSFPGQPRDPQVSGVACPASGVVSIGTVSPAVTAVYPDADNGQTITASFEWLEVPASGTFNDSTPRKPNPGTRPVPANLRSPPLTLPGVQNGKRYAFRTRGTDPAPYSLVSPWSVWCQFTVDTAVPPAPVVTATTLPTGPGTPGTFNFTVSASDVTRFRYGWASPPVTEIAATGTTVKSATVQLTAPKYGRNTLYVYAIDATGNRGNDGSLEFPVSRPAPALARWALETYPGLDQAGALADQQPALGGDTPLAFSTAGPDVRWATDARLVGGTTATFNPTADNLGGWLEAGVPALDTSRSFAAAAWVRLSALTGYQTVVAKEGAQVSVFRLQYRSDDDAWCFVLRARDVLGAPVARACAVRPVAGQWAHVAGAYDDTEGRLRLYVDGALVADVAPDATFAGQWTGGWNAAGPVTVGRALDRTYTPATVDHVKGEIADVQLFDRALVGHDFTGQRADDPASGGFDEAGILQPVEVGRWDFAAATPCYQTGIANTCQTPDAGPFGRELTFSQGVDVGLGLRDSGLHLDTTHWVDDPADPYHGLTTLEHAWSRRNSAPTGQPAQWQNAPVLRTDQSFTVSAWARPSEVIGTRTVVGQDGADSSGFYLGSRTVSGVTYWAFMMKDTDTAAGTVRLARTTAALTADDADKWVHLVGVFDAQRRELRLYVDGVLTATAARTAVPWTTGGPLTVGRARHAGGIVDPFVGMVDDVYAFQGALTPAAVATLHRAQAVSD